MISPPNAQLMKLDPSNILSPKNCIFHLCIPRVLAGAWNIVLSKCVLNKWTSTCMLCKKHSEKEKIISCIFIRVSMRQKILNAYVFIGNITQPQEKRNHLFILQKSMCCNTPHPHPPTQPRPEAAWRKGTPGVKIEAVLGKQDPGSVIYFPIIYGFSPFPSSLKSKHC